MKGKLVVVGLVLGWIALFVVGHPSPDAPAPWLPLAAFGGVVISSAVAILWLVSAARKDHVSPPANE